MASGAYIRAIAPAKARLSKALTDAQARSYTIPAGISTEDKVILLRKLEKGANEDLTKIQNAAAIVEKWMDKWIQHLSSTKVEDLPAEQKKFNEYADGSDGMLTNLDTANDASTK